MAKADRRLLALDQAKTSGYAVFVNDRLEHYGKFTYDDENIGLRLVKIRNKIIELIEEYDINELAFENIQMQNGNVVTFKTLAEIYGVIHELAEEIKIPYTIVGASTWKSTLDIKGRDRQAQKKNAQNYVECVYGVKASQDICDAICIGSHMIKKERPTPIEGLDWSD